MNKSKRFQLKLKLLHILRKIPMVKKYSLRIVLWIWPPKPDAWMKLFTWLNQENPEGESSSYNVLSLKEETMKYFDSMTFKEMLLFFVERYNKSIVTSSDNQWVVAKRYFNLAEKYLDQHYPAIAVPLEKGEDNKLWTRTPSTIFQLCRGLTSKHLEQTMKECGI